MESTTTSTSTHIRLRSEAFLSGAVMPRRHTGEGEDISPSLRWDRLPDHAVELAIICDDPDAVSAAPWVHWVIYKIPAEEVGLPEGIPTTSKVEEPPGSVQGKNSWGTIGYRGPIPPAGSGIHRYRFHLYALDRELSSPPELTKEGLLKAIQGKVIAEAELIATYQR